MNRHKNARTTAACRQSASERDLAAEMGVPECRRSGSRPSRHAISRRSRRVPPAWVPLQSVRPKTAFSSWQTSFFKANVCRKTHFAFGLDFLKQRTSGATVKTTPQAATILSSSAVKAGPSNVTLESSNRNRSITGFNSAFTCFWLYPLNKVPNKLRFTSLVFKNQSAIGNVRFMLYFIMIPWL